MSKTPPHHLPVSGFILTLLGAVLFSTKAIIVKVTFAKTSIDALTLLAMRMLFSLPFYVAAAWIGSNKKEATKFTKKQWLWIALLGLFGYYLSSLFDFVGLQYVSAGLERLILFLYPSFVLLINFFFFNQKITGAQKLALLLTYAGLMLAYIGELRIVDAGKNFYYGSFLIFLCAITYASYIVGGGRLIEKVGATRFTAYAMLFSTAGVFFHFAMAGHVYKIEQAAGFWGYGFSLALFATVAPTFLLSVGIKKIGANNVAIISSIGPVSTIVQAYFVLEEKIYTGQVIGTVLIIAGILLLGWKSRKNLAQTS
ncbi:MAG: DMT family transporter [Bacteroidetes bacterium]|nr:DMT family transporter [Bacteroidota bacterium]MBS1973505.1 DMT family transporter [Bacteroidota bacterium]